MEPGAAPAGGARNPAPGRPWAAVRPHYGGPPFGGLDAAPTKAGESLPDRGGRCPSVGARKYGPGDKNRRSGAPRGAPPSPRRRRASPRRVGRLRQPSGGLRQALSVSRRSAPSKGAQEGKTAYPAPQRIRAMAHARLRPGCLKIESKLKVFARARMRNPGALTRVLTPWTKNHASL
jgi:hypothetical protein